MEETLKGEYKAMWIEYQNSETLDIGDLTYDMLVERINKWEAIEFEARAKRQKCLAEKRTRDNHSKQADRDSLITNPKYTPADGPFGTGDSDKKGKSIGQSKPIAVKGVRMTKHEKLQAAMKDLGVDLGDLLGDIQKKKNPIVEESKGE